MGSWTEIAGFLVDLWGYETHASQPCKLAEGLSFARISRVMKDCSLALPVGSYRSNDEGVYLHCAIR